MQLSKHRFNESLSRIPQSYGKEGRMSEITVKCFRRGDLELPSRIRRQSHEKLEGNCHFRQHHKLARESQAQMASPVIKTRCQA